jgi:oligopeptide/dipeptide ABC transporter ATP-binding protein
MTLLQVRNLTTQFFTDEGVVKAVDGATFNLDKGKTLCIVGESGCGKSVMSLSLMRLIPEPPGRIVQGEIMFNDVQGERDLLKLSNEEMRRIRGKRIGMIFQEPMTSLNPVYTIGNQIGEAIALHEGGSNKQVKERTIRMLELVGIPAPEQRMREYPHQLSGGMRQRAMIAMALSCTPDILIADEPTTALDVTIQAQILDLMRELQRELGMAIIFVTHDLGVVAEMADQIAVMYAGKFVEVGTAQQIFNDPKHPYTQGLLKSIPSFEKGTEGKRLPTIPGVVPSLSNLPMGCAFADRCEKVKDRCRGEAVSEDPCNVGRLVRCFYA